MGEKVAICCLVLIFFGVIFGATIYGIWIYTEDYNRTDNKIEYEGLITQKRIEGGFRTSYIFILNNTTDVKISKDNYNKFSVGDYIIIYESLRIIKINLKEV